MKKVILLFLFLMSFGSMDAQRHSKAITFNGEYQHVRIPHSDDFNIPANRSYTITFWFNPSKIVPNPNFQRIICKRDLFANVMENTDRTGYEFWGLGGTDKEYIALNTPNAQGNHNNSLSVWISKIGALNSWNYVAFVVDRAANKMNVYYNGNLIQSSSGKDVSKWECTNKLPLYLGCGIDENTPKKFYNGKLDDVRFYKKALSASEIIADMSKESISPDEDGLVAAYDFEDLKDGDVYVKDITGRHNGELVGFWTNRTQNINSYSDVSTNAQVVGMDDNQPLACMSMYIKNPSEIKSIRLSLKWTTNISDVSRLKLVLGDRKDRFDTRKKHIEIASKTVSGDDVLFDRISTSSLNTGLNHIWILADIPKTAKDGNSIAVTLKNIVTGEDVYTPDNAQIHMSDIVLGRTLIWSPGDKGAASYRIPGIVKLNDGTLVASIDRRKNNSSDLPGDIDVEVKLSKDNGKTWSEPITVAQGTPSHGYGDAVMATDGKNIYMLMVGGSGLWSLDPSNIIRMYYTKSTDGGKSWTKVVDISRKIKNMEYPFGGFFGSGNGIVTSGGKICFVAAMRTDMRPGGRMDNFLVYSDDKGETWNMSKVARTNGDEAKVVELANGDLLISSRNRDSGINARTYVISKDNGKTWSQPQRWNELMGNSCNAGIARYTLTRNGEQKNRLLHTLPANANRKNLTLFLSEDEGKTWPVSRVLCKGEAAYSEIVVLPNGEIGIISEEKDNPAYDIYFTRVSLNWLTSWKDSYEKTYKKKSEQPEATPEGGYITKFPIKVTLSTLTEGAKIYYTLDGTNPTSKSNLYSHPIDIVKPLQLKAIAIKEGYDNSELLVVQYKDRINWNKPTGTTSGDRYVTSITTSNAQKNITYSASSAPKEVVTQIEDPIEFRKNETFSMNIKSTDELKWTHAIVYVDWNRDFDFDDEGEQIHREGIDADGPEDVNHDLYKKGNESVKDFSFVVQAPDNVTPQRTLMRIQFTDAWHKKNEFGHSHSAMDNIDKGRVYDIYLDILPTLQGVETVDDNAIKAYPTKIESVLTIESPERCKAIVYNLNGEMIARFDVEGKTTVDCSSWDKGELLLCIKDKTIKLIH